MRIKKDLTGKVFGSLTILGKYGPEHWSCLCKCGKMHIAGHYNLIKGSTTSCGCSRNIKLINIGDKFGSLTVVEGPFLKNSRKHYLCTCICGKSTVVSHRPLLVGDTTSCGCYRKEVTGLRRSLPKGIAAMNTWYMRYKKRALKLDMGEFAISRNDFDELTLKNCFYCGCPPYNEYKNGNSLVIRNGLDRVDNNLGYTTNNVVTACKVCNRLKHTLTQKDFLVHIKKIFKHNLDSAVKTKANPLIDAVVSIRLLNIYKMKARIRGLAFEVSLDCFREIVSSNCIYCGSPPTNKYIRGERASYYSGIDRVDNKLGYIMTNIVPCCWVCNDLKGSFNKSIFFEKVKSIYMNNERVFYEVV